MKSKNLMIVAFGAIVILGGYFYLNITPVFGALKSESRESNKPEVMIRSVIEWGRLSDFPETKKNFIITTEGSAFTRTFIGSFEGDPKVIDAWVKGSTGIQEGRSQELESGVKYILKTIPDCAYGEVLILDNGSKVQFKISWS